METKLEKQARYLKIYLALTLLFGIVFLSTDFTLQNRQITVNCIDLSGSKGGFSIAINIPKYTLRDRATERSQDYIKSEDVRYPGMIFYY